MTDPAPTDSAAFRITLFVAEGSPSAAMAQETLSAVLEACGLERIACRIVDVFADPAEALMAGIIATPALVVEMGQGRRVFLGDFRRRQDLQAFLMALGQGQGHRPRRPPGADATVPR